MMKHLACVSLLLLSLFLGSSLTYGQNPATERQRQPAKPPKDRQLTRPASTSPAADPTEPAPAATPSQPANQTPVQTLSPKPPQKKRIAILDFDNGSVAKELKDSMDPGKQIVNLIMDRLVNDGTYEVVTRGEVIKYQDETRDERNDQSSAAKIGKNVNANVVVMGRVNGFSILESGTTFGGIGRRKKVAQVGLTVRFVDVNTGVVLSSKTVGGKAEKGEWNVKNPDGSNFYTSGEDMNSVDFKQNILGQATYQAVDNAVKELVGFSSSLPNSPVVAQQQPASALSSTPVSPTSANQIKGKVADVSGDTIYLNVGSSHGVTPGRVFVIFRMRKVADPDDAKKMLEIPQEIGQTQITEVVAEGVSTGKIIKGTPKVGDSVKSQ